MKKDDLTNEMTGLFVKGGLILLGLLLAMSFFASIISGQSMFSPANWSVIKMIFIISLGIMLILFLVIMFMTVFVTNKTPEVSRSVLSKENTLRYENRDEKGRKRRKSFNIANIDTYLNKYKQMFIIDDIILSKKNESVKSSISNPLLKIPDGKELTLNQLYNTDPREYERICTFLDSISGYDEQELYWRLGSTVSKENLILNGNELIQELKQTAKSIKDKQISNMLNETITSITAIDENIGNYASRDRIRRVYDHYLPMLIRIIGNYQDIDFIEDKEKKESARNELISTLELINRALGSLADNNDEDKPESLEANVTEAEKLLEKVEKKA